MAKIGTGEHGRVKGRVGQVLAGEVPVGEVVLAQANPHKFVGLVAGRAVELRAVKPLDVVSESCPRTSVPVRSAPESVAEEKYCAESVAEEKSAFVRF